MNHEIPGTENILFTNCFSLKLAHTTVEGIFEEKISKNKIAMMIFIVLQILLIAGGTILLNTLDITLANELELNLTCYYGYAAVGYILVPFFLFIFHFKYAHAVSPFLYLNYISMKMSLLYFHEYMAIFLGVDMYFRKFYLIIISIEFLLILCYILFFDNNFVRLFISLVINYMVFVTFRILKEKDIQVYYIWCRISKESFYYKEKLEIQTNWIYDTLDHWNSGVIVYNLNHHKLKFINDYLKKYDEFQGKIYQNTEEIPLINNNYSDNILVGSGIKKGENLLVENYHYFDESQLILNKFNIFKHIFDVNKDIPVEIRSSFLSNDFQEIIDFINNYYSCECENIFFKEFIFLGHIYLNSGNNRGYFEISMHGFHSNQGDYYELMINDVSKTKQLEEERIKEKALILGKISHEFKNPLIVIDEVIEQLIETEAEQGIQNELQKELVNKMYFVKNLCNFMLILVKDFEVVASLENCLDIVPVNETLELRPFLLEIGQIIETLIIKKSSTNLFFKLSINEDLDKIEIDPIRLKQILINLLSNAVKFTGIGFIELKVEVLNMPKIKNSNILELGNEEIIEYAGNIRETNFQLIENNDNLIEMKNIHLFEENNFINGLDKIVIRFSVIDSGNGIPDKLVNLINSETMVNVFEKDIVSNNLGTGYGLNIVQRLCKVLGSKLNSSHKEECLPGSVFYFDLHLKKNNIVFIDRIAKEYKKENNQITEANQIISNYYDINNNNHYYNKDDDQTNIIMKTLKGESTDELIITKRSNAKTSKYDKLVFDHFPIEFNNINNIFKTFKETSEVSKIFKKFSNEIDDIPIVKTKSNINFPFHDNIFQLPVESLEKNLKIKLESFETVKRIYDIHLPRKFLQKDLVNQNNNKDNHLKSQKHNKINRTVQHKALFNNNIVTIYLICFH